MSSNPFGAPKTPSAPSSDAAPPANPFGAMSPSPGLATSPTFPESSAPAAGEDAKSADPFAFFAAPPPTMEEVEFIDPFGTAETDTAPQAEGGKAAERLEAEPDSEFAPSEEKEARKLDTVTTGNDDDDVDEEEYFDVDEEEDDVPIEITPEAIDQIRTWDPVSFSWSVGARHFVSNDDFRSLSSPVEMGYGHGFFLRLHLQGPRTGVELRIGDISADLVLRNMAIFLHCRDQYGQRIVAHAAALENGSCASEDDLNSFGCCPFVYENDDGVVVEVSRQMLYQQAKGGGLRIEGYFDVGAVR